MTLTRWIRFSPLTTVSVFMTIFTVADTINKLRGTGFNSQPSRVGVISKCPHKLAAGMTSFHKEEFTILKDVCSIKNQTNDKKKSNMSSIISYLHPHHWW